jgi:uncharacterized protein
MPKQWLHDPQAITAFLEQAPVGRLGTCGDGQPYVTPVAFCYHDQHFYVHTGPTGRKMENIRGNPRVCFEVDELERVHLGPSACRHSMRYTSVVALGTARLVHDETLKRQALTWLVRKYAPGEPDDEFTAQEMVGVEVLEIEIEELTAKQNVDVRRPAAV